MNPLQTKKELKQEIFLEDNREIDLIDEKDLSLKSVLTMIEERSQRDSEVLSIVCDDQANQ